MRRGSQITDQLVKLAQNVGYRPLKDILRSIAANVDDEKYLDSMASWCKLSDPRNQKEEY